MTWSSGAASGQPGAVAHWKELSELTTATVDTSLLTALGVSIRFRGVTALHDVSFGVQRGSVTALIGPNGAGKTTLFNCVSGLARCRGSIVFDGQELTRRPPHARAAMGIARTFQTPALLDGQNVLDNVLLGDYSQGPHGPFSGALAPGRTRRETAAAHERARDLLTRFGVWGDRDREVDALPHGHRRRIELVRCLMARPRLLMLDEPAAGLGPEESLPLFDRVAVWAAETDATILLVEHSMELVMSVADHVVVLAAGRLLAQGTPQSVQNDQRVVEVYLGE